MIDSMGENGQLRGMQCQNASCAEFIPGKGYFCKKHGTWAGSCQQRSVPLIFLYKEGEPGRLAVDSTVLTRIVSELSQDGTVEQGGILGVDQQGILTEFYHDRDAQLDESSYTPNSTAIENKIEQWRNDGITFFGLVHTHIHMPRLSRSDLVYTKRLLECNPNMEKVVMGLLVKGELRMYLFERDFVCWLDEKLEKNEPLHLGT